MTTTFHNAVDYIEKHSAEFQGQCYVYIMHIVILANVYFGIHYIIIMQLYDVVVCCLYMVYKHACSAKINCIYLIDWNARRI